MSRTIGDRIGAILSSDPKTVKLIGFGVYAGREVPSGDAVGIGSALHEMGIYNPKLVMDDGQIVWGCECWWGTESEVKSRIEGLEIIHVNMAEERRQAKETA
jgi:hypothetical protein